MMEKDDFLEKEFDFSKAIKNPYAKRVKNKPGPPNKRLTV